MVFRLDGHSFHRFSDVHDFEKPNDVRALQLMDHAARSVMEEYPDIVLAFGESDEYSFLLKRSTSLYNRREAKIVTTLTSYFTSSYVFNWSTYFRDKPLQYPPSFDGRIVPYPAEKHIRDYFAWRQADTHINNLYNTTFWALVQQGGQTTTEAHATLRGTFAKDKHEILFSRFKINYNQLDPRFRKGSVLVREEVAEQEPSSTKENLERSDVNAQVPSSLDSVATSEGSNATTVEDNGSPAEEQKRSGKKEKKVRKAKTKPPTRIVLLHCDIIKDDFWNERPSLLAE
ncbi:hypothetical protein EST38_g12764 [Candolleomyces aberdarensis]|uniref:tRNA(His) guanylyltransferase n=1 Tax=Candolleomyces aberdarensis TaxID=2316362 RepID=A0A4V1Q1X3_9AGAR|nr:hypothetical protein EST38_g12764 [Candolleomyces aberdarensis]